MLIINGKKLKTALRIAGLTQDVAANKLGISRQTLSTYMRTGELSPDFLQNVKTKLNIDLTTNEEILLSEPKSEYLLNHKGTPMYSSPATASEVEVYNDLQKEGPAFYVTIPQFRDCKFGKAVFGHSMYPTITSGSYIFCKQVTDKHHYLPGEIYYIEYDNFGVCKRMQKGPEKDEVLLVSDNDEIRSDGTRRYESFVIKIDSIRELFLVKGYFNQNHN